MFFTDGSKTEAGVGAAVAFKIMLNFHNFAISHALDIIKLNQIIKAIILSDSLSALTSINNRYQPNKLSRKIQNQTSSLKLNSQTITLIWIPNHIGIQENELANTYTKQAITSPDSLHLCCHTHQDIKQIIKISTP